MMANKNNEMCCMCGSRKDEVEKLIRGKYGYICDSCISIASDLLNDEEEENITNNMQLATPSQIKAHLDQYVIGQDGAKRTLAVAVYNHYKRLKQNKKSDVEIQKSNILMIGSTGSGKTYLAQSLAKFLGVPFAIADATTLTEAGYVGDDVEVMLRTLLQNADYDIQAAQRGIIYIDEIDKISRKGENMSITVSKLCANAQANYVMKLVAGKEGLGNYVRWVHLVENADVSPFLHGNEMVFMTGVGINDEGHLLRFVEELIEKRCSALVINTGKYIKSIPQSVKDCCDINSLPLFTVPWEVKLIDITYDFCHRIVTGEEIETALATALRNLICGYRYRRRCD